MKSTLHEAARSLCSAAVAVAAVAAFSAAALAATVTPSQLVANPDKYDKQAVTVSGKVGKYQLADSPRGQVAFYQICDDKCVNTIDATKPGYKNGATQTISGKFLKHFQGPLRSFNNVVMIQ